MIKYDYRNKRRTISEDARFFAQAKRACKDSEFDRTKRAGLPV
jgi:hypothetical protein